MGTIKAFLDNLLGQYQPITYTIDQTNVIPAGLSGIDVPYCVRAAVFIIVLWALLRIVGGMICRK